MDILIITVLILLLIVSIVVTWVDIPGAFITSGAAFIYGWATSKSIKKSLLK